MAPSLANGNFFKLPPESLWHNSSHLWWLPCFWGWWTLQAHLVHFPPETWNRSSLQGTLASLSEKWQLEIPISAQGVLSVPGLLFPGISCEGKELGNMYHSDMHHTDSFYSGSELQGFQLWPSVLCLSFLPPTVNVLLSNDIHKLLMWVTLHTVSHPVSPM